MKCFFNGVPWQIKIAAKIILSRLPVAYSLWQMINIFKHGHMLDPSYALTSFKNHYDRVTFHRKGDGFVSLELGPGDSLFSAIISAAHGGSVSYLVDVGAFAAKDPERYQVMKRFLKQAGFNVPSTKLWPNVGEYLRANNAQYLTAGVSSLREIPDASIDFVWSQAVLEHIKKEEFPLLLKEIRRILHPDGICSHRIDLRDHLSSSLNNLRFNEHIWESRFFASSGFYTNRIRFSEMLALFKEAGFSPEVVAIDKWNEVPIQVSSLARSFRRLSDEDLRTSGFDVVLRPI